MANYAYFEGPSGTETQIVDVDLAVNVLTGPSTTYGEEQLAIGPSLTRLYGIAGQNTTSSLGGVEVIDATTLAEIAAIPVGVSPNGFAVTPDELFMYVACEYDVVPPPFGSVGGVYVIDLTTLAVATIIGGGTLNEPFGVAMDPTGTYVYVGTLGEILQIEVATNTIINTINTGSDAMLSGVVDPTNSYLFYVDGSTDLKVLDIATLTITTGPSIGSSYIAYASVVISVDGSSLYILSASDVQVIDVLTLTITATLVMSTGFGEAISVDPNGHVVIVGTASGFYVIDVASVSISSVRGSTNGAVAAGPYTPVGGQIMMM